MKTAPSPRPGLSAVSDPCISLAAFADACRPYPCPFFFVVNPALNKWLCVFSSMPMPLSVTERQSFASFMYADNFISGEIWGWLRAEAMLLRIKLTRICRILCFSNG